MAKIKTLDQESNPLDGVSVVVFDSLGKKVGGVATNSKGEADIPESYLSDKNGLIKLSRVGYNPTQVKVSEFRGIAYLGKKESTLGEVVIVRKKTKPFTIKVPTEAQTTTTTKPPEKKKGVAVKIIGGGILLGLLTLLIVKAKN